MSGDLPGTVLLAMMLAADPGLVKLALVSVIAAAVAAGMVLFSWLGRHDEPGDAASPDSRDLPPCACLACAAAGTADEEDEIAPDDLMELADAVFDGEQPRTPVNEPHPTRWPVMDNRGPWFDRLSRTSTEQNARWITGRQQEQVGQSLADEAADFLAAEAARRKRWEAAHETTGEIRRPGDPGE